MESLERLWPDPQRNRAAMYRLLVDVIRAEPRTTLRPSERRVLEALSRGLGERGAADVLGWTPASVHTICKQARQVLRAKNTTHACCEALRQGLIR